MLRNTINLAIRVVIATQTDGQSRGDLRSAGVASNELFFFLEN